jgi:Zn-finger nucleic acid-binding protein
VGRVFEAIEYAECARCGGLFLSSRVFDSVTRDADLRAHVHGLERVEAGTPAAGKLPPVRYRKCPGCHTLMNRVNFAGVSRIVIDVCRKDGVWFDRGELTGIVEFLEDGGLEKSRSRDRERLRLEISELEARKAQGGIPGAFLGVEDDGTNVLSRVVGFLHSIL